MERQPHNPNDRDHDISLDRDKVEHIARLTLNIVEAGGRFYVFAK